MTDTVAARLLAWFDQYGRKDLPWQRTDASGRRDPYRVWLSEVMLQQTQVSTVIDYFNRFTAALPTLRALAAADEDRVFALWSGLGYYRRARHLHQAAQRCIACHGGRLPDNLAELMALPGIGRSTAGAILAQAFGQRAPILDGNVKRVLARYHGVAGYPGISAVENRLWQLATTHTPQQHTADYTQAVMDLGATVCTRARPDCAACPLAADCVAYGQGRIDELPTRKPARQVPTRHVCMLVLRDTRHRVLLERRGPSGVWSGLWSLPEADTMDAARHYAHTHAGVADGLTLTAFTHQFTHYRLNVTPLLFAGAKVKPAIGDGDQLRWYTSTQWARLGLPAPVRRLLLQINDKPASGAHHARRLPVPTTETP